MTAERALPTLKLSPTAAGVLERQEDRLDHVVDVAPRADLRAVAVDLEVAPAERRLDERADRAAADLARAVDVERAHGDRRQPELGVVGVRHVLAGELRDGVRPARLADRADRRDVGLLDVERVLAEHLARRELDEPLDGVARRERGLERVVGADRRSRASSAPGSRPRCRPRRSRRRGRRACSRPSSSVSCARSSTSPSTKRKFGCVLELRARQRVAVEVVDRDHLVLVDEATARASCR